MNARRTLTVAAVLLGATLLAAPEAEARWGWRKARWTNNRSRGVSQGYRSTGTTQAWRDAQRPSTGPLNYSGISRAEYDYWRRRDAWYEEAYNGWRPEFFH